MGFCINCHRQHVKNDNAALMDCTTCHF
jgi:hypothetical protein